MNAQALQRLDFMVGLIDKVSGPAGKMMKTMDRVTTSIQSGYQKIGYGAAGIAGAGFALDRLLAPTKELDNALRTVKSLDVVDSVLANLTKSSLKFSMQYGESATEFVNASYDIQSAIGGLVGDELSKFTTVSAVLAKGTKADISTITNYVGTMYGIFKNSADLMGKGQWVEMLAGQTASAVQIFKTTGAEMSASFTRVGASATSHGIAMNEQIAILGTLQATMSGSEAGTRYKAFLDGVGKAQGTLGLSFIDSHGKMLPMIDIMNKIQGKFGDLGTVADSDLLKKAFGSKEAVDLIKLLSADVSGLNSSINLIGDQKGMNKAIQMAEAMIDPWGVAGKQLEAIQIVIGKTLMPTLLPFLSALGDGANKILRWTELFPNLTKYVGVGVLSILGLIAAFSALSIVVGVSKFVMVGWSVALGALKVVLLATKFSLVTLLPVVWGFTAALLANPITWIIAAIALLGYGLYKLNEKFAIFDFIKEKFTALKTFLSNIDVFGVLMAPIIFIKNELANLLPQWAIDLLPGAGGGATTISPPSALRSTNVRRGGPNGGLVNRISNASSNNSRSIGEINIYNSGGAMSSGDLLDAFEFEAG